MRPVPVMRGRTEVGWTRVVLAIVCRPWLWPVATTTFVGLIPRRWWARHPWLPVPDAGFLTFRLTTAFGPDPSAPPPAEVISFLRWCRTWPRVVRR
ncbi:MAG: hypothetical protein U5K29_01045 [Acidimicrobiales bacterium]|nr:hypothetical protein [Acidimicrobiales bacterium]